MRITEYSFGRITVDGRDYDADVIIYPDRVDGSWWRREGHRLEIEDLAGVLAARPEVVVLGTGHDGMMDVPEGTLARLRALGLEVHSARTAEAVRIFNELEPRRRVVAALHLTC
jgi:hypothetical protein